MTYSQINPAWDRMHRTSESQIVQERVVKEPYWTDHCTHGHDCYVDSFIYRGRDITNLSKIDIYVYPDDYHGHEICLRYGDEDHEYFSPTGFPNFIRATTAMPLYMQALEVMLRKGKIKFERNKE